MLVEVEDHSLPLAEHAEHRARQRSRRQLVFAPVGVANHDPLTRFGVVGLDDALHALLLGSNSWTLAVGASSQPLAASPVGCRQPPWVRPGSGTTRPSLERSTARRWSRPTRWSRACTVTSRWPRSRLWGGRRGP